MSAPAGAITFDDGMLHVIDAANSYPFEFSDVRDDVLGSPTILNIVARNVQSELNSILGKLFKYLKTFRMFHGERWMVVARQGGRPGSGFDWMSGWGSRAGCGRAVEDRRRALDQ
jgi:hypothetical protein